MSGYGSYCEDYYLNLNLGTEMDLPQGRESVLHFFEQVRRRFPSMAHFYGREKQEFVLEEEKGQGPYRWVSIEPRRINSGYVNPENLDDAMLQHEAVLELVPYELSVSPLDCESLGVVLGFDFTCRGNHSEVLAEALGMSPAMEKFFAIPNSKMLAIEPAIQFALDDDCKTQVRVSFESRTTAYHVRTGDFPEEQLSVYLMVRRFESLGPGETYVDEFRRLATLCREIADEYLVGSVLMPLQQAISLR
ncbi:MAG TPA: hypothetical protein DDZ51_11945 [Planctomycetaceae bacterium]|nr:hypothetical protein [Planctomycetaceae bacterium]